MRRDPLSLLPEPGDPLSMYVFDLPGFVWRTFKAPGQAAHAALSFVKLMRRVLRDRRPSRVVVARDNPHPTFRHELVREHRALLGMEEYKAARREGEDPAERARGLEQCRLAEEMVEDAYGVVSHTLRGYEGDDVVATAVQRGLDAGLRVVVAAHDGDFCQLVTTDSSRCVMWDTKYRVLDALGVEAKFGRGCFPDRVTEYLAVVGDKDEVPGVKGAGDVAALKLVNAFPSLDAALASAHRGERDHAFWQKEPKLWAKMVAQVDRARVGLRLATLVRDAPLPADLLDAALVRTREAVRLAVADQPGSAPADEPGGED